MKNSVIAIQSYVITTIVYALLAPIFFEIENNAFGKGEYFVDDDDNNNKIMYSQQVVDTKCKSPCPSSAEMCIAMCA
ncbi:MAG TPA: hypothetical protein VHJ38_00290 [Nitrososphaeraceae archaeon]|jgi:hypothetical protein|nr:hypothetical protein [Nitrososphaeraceae archaeon]